MEKKLITPPEILCKKMPVEFSYYFHYCRNLKFEDRPDYSTLKTLFADLLSTRINLKEEVMFDWFDETNSYKERKNNELKLSGRKVEDDNDDKKNKFHGGTFDEYDQGIKEESKEDESNIKDIKNDNSRNKEIQPEEQKQNDLKSSISSASDDVESKKKQSKRDQNLISEDKDKEKGGLIEEKNSVSTDFKLLNKDK